MGVLCVCVCVCVCLCVCFGGMGRGGRGSVCPFPCCVGVHALLSFFVLSRRVPCAGGKDAFLAEQSQLVLLACVLALTPQEERGSQERQQLRALAESQALRDKVLGE